MIIPASPVIMSLVDFAIPFVFIVPGLVIAIFFVISVRYFSKTEKTFAGKI